MLELKLHDAELPAWFEEEILGGPVALLLPAPKFSKFLHGAAITAQPPLPREVLLCQGGTVILTESFHNDSKITV